MERQPDSDDDGVRPDAFQPVVPKTGRMELDVQPLAEGDPEYILVFKNEFKDNGCISIRKFGLCEEVRPATASLSTSNTGYGAAGWGFKLERSDGTIARQGVTDAEGYLTFDRLPYGPYTIVEEERAGLGRRVAEAYVDVTVEGGECVLVPFENQQDDSGFCIEGYKLDANGGYGIPNWKIETDPVDDGGYEPDDVFTDGLGKYTIRVPGQRLPNPGL